MGTASQEDDTGICWICAEPVKYYSVSECNHRTCYVCALRLRALYNKQECVFCKVRLSPPTETELDLRVNLHFSIGTPTFRDLHDISNRDVRIV